MMEIILATIFTTAFGYGMGYLSRRYPRATRAIAWAYIVVTLIWTRSFSVGPIGSGGNESWWPVIGLTVGFIVGLVRYRHLEEINK